GVAEVSLDRVVHASTQRADGCYSIPGASELVGRAFREVETMLVPLRVAAVDASAQLDERLHQLKQVVQPDGDAITAAHLSRLTAGRPRAGRTGDRDSLH